MKGLNVPAFPCCPVSTQPFRDLLLMWKLAQPQCSFILDFCFVNTSYVVGDMTWASYLSPSPSSSYTGSLMLFQSGWNTTQFPKHGTYSSATAGGGWSQQANQRAAVLLPLPAPPPLQEHSGCAVLHSNPGRLPRGAPSARTPCPYSKRAARCALLRKCGGSKVLRRLS